MCVHIYVCVYTQKDISFYILVFFYMFNIKIFPSLFILHTYINILIFVKFLHNFLSQIINFIICRNYF